jgi:hypothetical protein
MPRISLHKSLPHCLSLKLIILASSMILQLPMMCVCSGSGSQYIKDRIKDSIEMTDMTQIDATCKISFFGDCHYI